MEALKAIGLGLLGLLAVMTFMKMTYFRDVSTKGHAAQFADTLSSLKWTQAQASEDMDAAFNALTGVLGVEISYYHRHRLRSSAAALLRGAACVFGAVGLLIPLLPPILWRGERVEVAPEWGYPCLVLAGAFLTANRVMGLTNGHYRYVRAQLVLENLVTGLGLHWAQLKAAQQADGGSVASLHAAGFELFEKTRARAFEIILAETDEWGRYTAAEEAAYAALLNGAKAEAARVKAAETAAGKEQAAAGAAKRAARAGRRRAGAPVREAG